MLDIAGKEFLVTGATGFLGTELCSQLEERGAFVHKMDLGGKDGVIDVDVSDPYRVKEIMDNWYNRGVELDGIINNAAVSFKGRHSNKKQFMKTIEINTFGYTNIIDNATKLLSDGASIVNVASIYGVLSPEFSIYDGDESQYSSCSYGASKAAIVQLTRYYALQLAPKFRVNAVSPGGIEQEQSNVFVENYSRRVPMKRMARVSEIAGTIIFLLSSASSYITGQNLMVDGGLSAK